MNASPWAYCLSLASMPSERCTALARLPPWRRRSLSAREKRGAEGTWPRPARSIVTSPWPSSRLIIPPMRDLRGGKPNPLSEPQQVGPAVVEGVRAAGLLVLKDQRVVLAQHGARH